MPDLRSRHLATTRHEKHHMFSGLMLLLLILHYLIARRFYHSQLSHVNHFNHYILLLLCYCRTAILLVRIVNIIDVHLSNIHIHTGLLSISPTIVFLDHYVYCGVLAVGLGIVHVGVCFFAV